VESFRELLKKRDVKFQTDGGTRLVFRGDSCTVCHGGKVITLPSSGYLPVSRILSQAHELLQMPENKKVWSR
jgi:hypothetical protein